MDKQQSGWIIRAAGCMYIPQYFIIVRIKSVHSFAHRFVLMIVVITGQRGLRFALTGFCLLAYRPGPYCRTYICFGLVPYACQAPIAGSSLSEDGEAEGLTAG